MDSNLDKIALDLYGKIQTRFPSIKIGDENAAVLSKKEDIPNARFFEFEYSENGEALGTIAITLDADDGIVVQVSGDLVNDSRDSTSHSAYKFIRSFRSFAKDRLLNFDVQNIGKSNLDKRDYDFQAKRKELPMEPMMENKMYGNARMSYQDLGENARLVVKHNAPINLDLAAGRTMHIESIYIENAVGERFKYPFKHLNGARALAEHIKAGGNPYDGIGKHITGLSEELASLRKFKGFVSRQQQVSEAMGTVTDRVIERIDQIKETIHKLQRKSYYETFAESFVAQEEEMIPEEVQNDLIDRLTVRTFNEELKSVFPYIAKFVKESELEVIELGADELLDEVFDGDKETGTTHKGGKVTKTAHGVKHTKGDYEGNQSTFADRDDDKLQKGFVNKIDRVNNVKFDREKKWGGGLNIEEQFESFMDSIISEDDGMQADTDRITQLNDIMSQELKGGPEGVNAIETLTGLINDPEFLDELRNIDPDLDVRPLVQQHLQLNEPEVAKQLRIGDEEAGGQDNPEVTAAPGPAEVPPAAPEATAEVPLEPAVPAPAEAPLAEEGDEKKGSWRTETPWKKADQKKNPEGKVHNIAGQALKKSIEKAKKAGATLETKLDFGHKEMTLKDAIQESGMDPADFGFEDQGGVDAILKFVSGFYDKGTSSFPLGAERVKIKVKKAWEDGEFGNVDVSEVKQVLAFIDKKDPGSHPGQQNDIARLAGVSNGHSIPKFDEKMEALGSEFSSKPAVATPLPEGDELSTIKKLIGKI